MESLERRPLSEKILEQQIKPRLRHGDIDGIARILQGARVGEYRCHWNEALWFSLVGRMVSELMGRYDGEFENQWPVFWEQGVKDDLLQRVTARLFAERPEPNLADLFRYCIDAGIPLNDVINTLDQVWLTYRSEGRKGYA